ncbi:hypothetical protein RRG08_008443 [Elysia crispata]|uniref:Uncharacterized protein n=1 Tax=Elysia crispata TaxID=231223 RepID=A0AAE1AZD0_9GAST|nr:hypothetical protein RRG08_008443 [Elysia crispata]
MDLWDTRNSGYEEQYIDTQDTTNELCHQRAPLAQSEDRDRFIPLVSVTISWFSASGQCAVSGDDLWSFLQRNDWFTQNEWILENIVGPRPREAVACLGDHSREHRLAAIDICVSKIINVLSFL